MPTFDWHVLGQARVGLALALALAWPTRKGRYVDQIGLLLLLAFTSAGAVLFDKNWLLLFPVGIITADVVQHMTFSAVKRGYTPGAATSALYLVYVINFFVGVGQQLLDDPEWGWVVLAVGMAVIAGNYFLAWRKVRSGACRIPGAPVAAQVSPAR